MSRSGIVVAVVAMAAGCGDHDCGADLSCACNCAVCNQRDDGGYCIGVESTPKQLEVRVCQPVRARGAELCGSVIAADLDAGVHSALRQACAKTCSVSTGAPPVDRWLCIVTNFTDRVNPVVTSPDNPECSVAR